MLAQKLFPSLWTSELCIEEQARGLVVGLLEEVIFYSNSKMIRNAPSLSQVWSLIQTGGSKWVCWHPCCVSTGQLEEPGATSTDTPGGSHIDRWAGSWVRATQGNAVEPHANWKSLPPAPSPAAQLDPQGISRDSYQPSPEMIFATHWHFLHSSRQLHLWGLLGVHWRSYSGWWVSRLASLRRWCLALNWELLGLNIPSPLPYPNPKVTFPKKELLQNIPALAPSDVPAMQAAPEWQPSPLCAVALGWLQKGHSRSVMRIQAREPHPQHFQRGGRMRGTASGMQTCLQVLLKQRWGWEALTIGTSKVYLNSSYFVKPVKQ